VANAVRIVFLEAIAMPLVALAAPRVKRDSTREPEAPLLIVANHVTLFDVPILPRIERANVAAIAVAMAGELLSLAARADKATGFESACSGRPLPGDGAFQRLSVAAVGRFSRELRTWPARWTAMF
jgi:hypothetical protein